MAEKHQNISKFLFEVVVRAVTVYFSYFLQYLQK